MFERFTDRARKVMALANQEAQRFNHEYVGTEHILLGLVKEGSGVGATVLKNLDVDIKKLRLEIEKLVKSGPDMVTMGKLPQTPRAKKVIEYAIEEARALNHNYVGTEHILLGLVKEGSGVGANVLDVDLRKVRLEVEKLVKSGPETVTMGKLPQTPRAKRVIGCAIEEARNLNHDHVGMEHLLLGLCRDDEAAAAKDLLWHVLADRQVTVIEFSRRKYELEEIFMEIVKGDDDGR